MVGSISIPEIVIIMIVLAAVVWPAARICRRVGLSPLLGILAVVPLANVLLLWYVALAPWPASKGV
jgi:hypothetical protein